MPAAATEEEEEERARSRSRTTPRISPSLTARGDCPSFSFAILLAGTLIAIGIWQLSSADGASKANASSELAGATVPPLPPRLSRRCSGPVVVGGA